MAIMVDRAGSRGARRIVGVLLAALTVLAAPAAPPVSAEPDARRFAAQALALRAAGVAGDARAGEVLAAVPGAAATGTHETLRPMWSPFFQNAIVKLGRLRSRRPVALYYNPLLDVALLTLWDEGRDGYRLARIRATPGERLADPNAGVTLDPRWTADAAGPVAALRRVTIDRLASFGRTHPAEARDAATDRTTFAAAAADMRDVQSRLLWNTAMRLHWSAERSAWLDPVLERVDAVLATRDAAAIEAAAPDTDAVTAGALASLPSGFADALVLDMTLVAGGDHRLVIASPSEDGHVYAFALCRLDGGACALRRFMLTSLEE